MKDLQSELIQNQPPEAPIKKVWIKPVVEIIDQADVNSKTHASFNERTLSSRYGFHQGSGGVYSYVVHS